MKSTITWLVLFMALIMAGCQTLHTTSDGRAPLAVWSTMDVARQEGDPIKPRTAELIAAALKKAGIHATIDGSGVSVADADEERAQRVLIADPSLKETGAVTIVAVRAGTGQWIGGKLMVPVEQSSTTQP
jgi:hypothetical protein